MPRHSTAIHWREEEETYPGLREVLAPEYAGLPPEQLEQLLEGVLGEVSPEDLENFWNGVKKFAKKAAPVLKTALPVVATVAGTAIGGPVGGALGGMAGKALSGAIGAAGAGGSGRARRPGRPGLPRGLKGVKLPRGVPSLPGRGAAPAAPAAPAAAQLLRVINEPQTLQALLAMALGGAGQRQVPVGDEPVPVAAFANLLGQLANQAAAEHHQLVAGEAAGTPSYLLDDTGEFVCDPADPVQRAEVLLARLNEADDEADDELYAEDDSEADDDAEDEEDVDELYDELELVELYAGEED